MSASPLVVITIGGYIRSSKNEYNLFRDLENLSIQYIKKENSENSNDNLKNAEEFF